LWRQYRKAAEQLKKKSPYFQAKNEITEITRDHVLNLQTALVSRLCAVDDHDWSGKNEYAPGDREFFALLGTPNGKSSAFILMDHNKHMFGTKTIDKVEMDGGHEIRGKKPKPVIDRLTFEMKDATLPEPETVDEMPPDLKVVDQPSLDEEQRPGGQGRSALFDFLKKISLPKLFTFISKHED